jgi:hypothetical protein
MSEDLSLSLFDSLEQVPDPRRERTKLHLLVDILVIAVCATICAAETWEEIEEFGQAKRHMAVNLLKQERSCKLGIKSKRLKAGWDESYMLKVLNI